MLEGNKAILEKANAAIAEGDNEGFLAFCAEDTEWTFVGERTLKGKESVRQWMATTYREPPKFAVANMIAEGDFVVALAASRRRTMTEMRLVPRTATSGAFATARSSS